MKDIQEGKQQQNNRLIPFCGFLNAILEDYPLLHHHKIKKGNIILLEDMGYIYLNKEPFKYEERKFDFIELFK